MDDSLVFPENDTEADVFDPHLLRIEPPCLCTGSKHPVQMDGLEVTVMMMMMIIIIIVIIIIIIVIIIIMMMIIIIIVEMLHIAEVITWIGFHGFLENTGNNLYVI